MKQSFFRLLSVVTCFATANLSVPYGALATLGVPIRESLEQGLKAKPATTKSEVSRPLSLKETHTLQGKAGECPYLAGANKWDVVFEGVDVMTGNLTSGGSDLAFDGGFGISVSVTRSYSSNDGSEGPFGKGWTLSADARATAGGIKKSKYTPVRSVPTLFKERSTQDGGDPNIAVQPAASVTAVDAGGTQETVQKDVDGVLTTPPWDNNVSNPTYAWVTLNGNLFQVQTGNTTTTPDGTVYTYAAEGSYPNGTLPWNASQITPAPTPEAANVLKVTKVVDRQGNVTTYTYNQSVWVNFNRIDGTTKEHPLTGVQMPNGHTITFTWGNGTNAPTNRIVSASDGTRTVSYGYTAIQGQSVLTSVTSPAGKTTTYGYGAPEVPPGYSGGSIPINLLTSITDQRGLTTRMVYVMNYATVLPYLVNVYGPCCCKVIQPNGNEFYLSTPNNPIGQIDSDWPSDLGAGQGHIEDWEEWTGSATNSQSVRLSGGSLYATNTNGSLQVILLGPSGRADNNAGDPTYPCGDVGIPYGGAMLTYDAMSQNLLDSAVYNAISTRSWADIAASRGMGYQGLSPGPYATLDDHATTYNFLGNPLTKTDTEFYRPGSQTTRTAVTRFAYWDSTKYFQQKAVMDQAGRFAFADYYPSTAPPGSKGMQYQVFDSAHGGIHLDHSLPVPSYVTDHADDDWRYQVVATAGQYTSQSVYDSVGRCTDLYKLQSTTSNPWTYQHTQTTYGAITDGSWGQASKVVEDTGGINRTTQNLHYTSWGKPDQVVDAAGHQFNTVYDLDGDVLNVTRVDSGLNQSVATYVYGTTPNTVTFGQLVSATDGLTNLTDALTYQTSGGGIGKVSQVTESGGPNPSYTVGYSYTPAGDRWQATYTTVNGTKTWQYDNYETVGYLGAERRIYQTLTLLNNGQLTAEQMQYAYDYSGALVQSAFAQTPAAGFTPASGQPWYDASHQASSRARAVYTYDPAGRILTLEYDWDHNGTTTPISQNNCLYETTGLNRGVKTSSQFNVWQNGAWSQSRNETYSYDPNLDYLTGANYGDGLPNASPTWSYDAAGNRTDSVCDRLNRTTSISGVSTSCDILGNRLTLGTSVSYGWDVSNRETSYTSSGVSNSYWYRLDGMRVAKMVGSTGTTTSYAYDGKSGIEDTDITGTATTVTDYGLGGRSIDYIASTSSGTTTVGYPLYDAHGNMSSCLFRASGGTFSQGNPRSFDAWGQIRQGAATGDPKARYCANLGHKQDDESGLIYMRARYFEPGSGRFISQDVSHNSSNWFIYCQNDPINMADATGKNPIVILALIIIAMGFIAGVMVYCGQQDAQGKDWDFGDAVVAGLEGAALAFITTVITIVAALLIPALMEGLVVGLAIAALAAMAAASLGYDVGYGCQKAWDWFKHATGLEAALIGLAVDQIACALELAADDSE